ncbi:MAG TPA: hypothetical protein VFG84_06585 [Gemmatimonadaceae bacterium]|nr:hypothetical protein [Gemmatimonadaceae bacterium]
MKNRDTSLRELLADRARRASDARLALDVGVGLLVSVAAIIWRPGPWHLLLAAALCFVSFGAWGIADRELHGRPDGDPSLSRHVLSALRLLAAVIGASAALLLAFGALALALGTWIS